jgi:hypothetical protein
LGVIEAAMLGTSPIREGGVTRLAAHLLASVFLLPRQCWAREGSG